MSEQIIRGDTPPGFEGIDFAGLFREIWFDMGGNDLWSDTKEVGTDPFESIRRELLDSPDENEGALAQRLNRFDQL